MTRPLAAATALACALLILAVVVWPARAAEGGALAGAVTIPWGTWLVEVAQGLTALLLPALVAALVGLAARLPGPLRLHVTAGLVERLARNAADYALNAVAGAARDRSLSVPLGSAVLAAAVQRAVDQAPAWLLDAAGGPRGIAEKVFRLLHLDEGASAANTLHPVLAAREARR